MKKGRSIWARLAALVLLYLMAMSIVILITLLIVEKCMGVQLQTAEDFINEDKLDRLTLDSDGFYEIKSREDYMIFWEAVEDGNFNINGRLLNDIQLNDTSDIENWGCITPEYICGRAKHYSGTFDGGGYTVYGLYAKDGYGIVCNNNGSILNLNIKDSVIRGGVQGAGICFYNSSSGALISNCSFYGEISSTYSRIPASLSGICAYNEGTIDKCGFMGRMNLKNSAADSCDVAGICMTNLGKISNCYNLSQSAFEGKGKKYAIADTGEKNCYMLVNTGWLSYTHRTLPLTVEQSFFIDAYINKDINALINKNRPAWMTQLESMQKGLIRKSDDMDSGNLPVKEESVQTALLYGALQDEVVRNIVFAIMCQKNSSIENFSFEAEKLDEGFCLSITCGKESILLHKYPVNDIFGEDEFWEKCSSILSEKNKDTWTHETYILMPEYVLLPENTFEEKLLFYHTKSGKNGIFYVNGENLYQMIPESMDGEEELALAKDYLLTAYDAYRDKKKDEKDGEEGSKKLSSFQIALREVLEDKIPGDGVLWKDEKVREAVCKGISGDRDILLTREEIVNFRNLEIPDGEGLKTLMDLEKLPNLTCLYIAGCENEKAIRDLEKLQLNHLTELYLIVCKITDISFMKNMTELTEVSLFSNQISDIAPLTACKKLKVISLGMNHISDISPLSELPALEEAGLEWNQIENIESLENLERLTAVNLSANLVEDLSPLKNNTGITALGLAHNNIEDISPLQNMTNMTNLSLSLNRIRDISALKGMTDMEWLDLSSNQIEDFTPIEDMHSLFFLDVSDNPSQDIGGLCMVPSLTVGMRLTQGNHSEELEWAQVLLNQYESQQGLFAEDIAWGDFNNDGVRDIAITGRTGEETDEEGRITDWGKRKVYSFLGLTDGSYTPITAVQTFNPDEGGIWGDPYLGIAICNNRLVVQCYGGSHFRWARTDIYEYQDGYLEESCILSLDNYVGSFGYDWYVWDLKKEAEKKYAFSGEIERHMEKLLLADDDESEEKSGLKEEYAACMSQLEQRADVKLPEIESRNYMPDVDKGYYLYEIHEPLYETKKAADFILWYTAQAYMKDVQKFPIPEYGNEEIKHSYDTLTGVELPDCFYAGKGGFKYPFYENVQALTYEKCMEEDGGYVHVMKVWEADVENDCWNYVTRVYYHESTASFEIP